MNDLLTTIKEVQEGGRDLANYYLNNGYILLDVQSGTRLRKYPDDAVGSQNYYVRHNPVYVVGRPDDVARVDPPPFRGVTRIDPPPFRGVTRIDPPPGQTDAKPQ